MVCDLCLHSESSRCLHDLSYFLPAGVLELGLEDTASRSCDPISSWNAFNALFLSKHLTNAQDLDLCRQIEFLVQHSFISAQFKAWSSRNACVIRIYIIPYDLPGVQGRLRSRKSDILSVARKYLRLLLPLVVQDTEAWDGEMDYGAASGGSILAKCQDPRTLAEIYGDIVSPNPSAWPNCGSVLPRLLDFTDDLEGMGLKTHLFHYQRRTVAAMLQKELDPRDIPDPLFVPIVGIDTTTFYLQPATMEVLAEKPFVSPTRGGILCEELGTGKTVMTLTLILSTLNELSSPEPSIVDAHRPVLTPVSLRHFPTPLCHTARQRAHYPSTETQLPSLVELLLHQVRVRPPKLDKMQDMLEGTRLWPYLQQNGPFYHHYEGTLADLDRRKRATYTPGPKTMFLTTASLVVVPTNLIGQWAAELNKHFATPIRVLIARRKDKLPLPRTLANDYDIVLLTYDKLSQEASRSDVSTLFTWSTCQCRTMSSEARVPLCDCSGESSVSPLLQIRWKRLVIDEGHVSGTVQNNLHRMTRLLSVERKWVVTGTPTTHLLGLSFGSGATEGSGISEEDSDEMVSRPPSSGSTGVRKWNKSDSQDLSKLAIMMTHFIGVPLFQGDTKIFHQHVSSALMQRPSPASGAISVLAQVMEMVMIRHRIEDVEKDVVLPPIHQEVVLLDLDIYALRSYNALQAIIAINAIDSERKDQDYLFHSRNTDSLLELVQNISQVLFYGISSNLYNTGELRLKRGEYLQRAASRGTPAEDIALIQDAFEQIELAASDNAWKQTQLHEDVPYRVHSMDPEIFSTWTRVTNPDLAVPCAGLMHCDRLLRIKEEMIARPLMSKRELLKKSQEVAEHDAMARLALEAKKASKKPERPTKTRIPQEQETSTQSSVLAASKSHVNHAKVQEVHHELQLALERREALDHAEENHLLPADQQILHANTSQNRLPSSLLSSSVVSSVRVGSSASSKLDVILDEVKNYAPTDKFLIFSDSPLTLAHIAEGLDLIEVKYLRFSTQIDPKIREHFVMTYETSETYRVFLMELKHGARGLNLISASRIIFCEPIWRPDVESQAIKRAHRIGQTRPITVKTLAIRDTHEEKMLGRREALKGLNVVPTLTNETGMRDYIANPRFLRRIRDPSPNPTISLLSPVDLSSATPDPAANDSHTDFIVADDPAGPSAQEAPTNAMIIETDGIEGPPPAKKRRMVAFVE